MNIVYKVKSANVGCYLFNICVSIFLYADDILLIAPTVTGLQTLLAVCEQELLELDMKLNVAKSICIRFGEQFEAVCSDIVSAQGGNLQWVDSCRYLGVYFISGRVFRCSFHNAKCSFFRSFNAIFSKVGRFASEHVILSLIRTKCLPILLYGLEACPVLKRDKHSLDFTLTRLFMKLFRTGSPAIVAECQLQFNFLPLQYQVDIRTASFMFRYINSVNSLCLCLSAHAIANLASILSCYGESVSSMFDLRTAISKLLVTM